MQRAERSSRLVPESPETRVGLRPGAAFLLLSLVVAVVGAAIYLTRPEPAPTPTGIQTATEPNFALTNEEAIARFEELHERELTAYETADPSLIDNLFTPNSPIAPTVRSEIRTLVNDQVVAITTYETKALSVVRNDPQEIQLKQVAIVRGRFLDKQGRDVTDRSPTQLQTIRWTLRIHDASWRLHDAVITASRVTGN